MKKIATVPLLLMITFLAASQGVYGQQGEQSGHHQSEYKEINFSASGALQAGNDTFYATNDGTVELSAEVREGSIVSEPVRIPIEQADPFIAITATWEASVSDDHLIRLHLRTSQNGGEWGDWTAVEIDHHVEAVEGKHTGHLMFFDKESRYVQYRVTMARSLYGVSPELQAVNLIFINPGSTGQEAMAEIKSKTPENRGALKFTPSVKTDESIPNYIDIQNAIPLPEYVDRETWGQQLGLTNTASRTPTLVTHLVVHHSASDNDSNDFAAVVRSYWSFHVNSNGWADIGYNWLVDPNGVIYQGRAASLDGNYDVIGAHASGNNSNTMGICVIGNYNTTVPVDAARISLHEMLAWKAADRNIDPLASSVKSGFGNPLPHIGGHRDYGTTDCPGHAFYPQLPSVRNAVDAILKGEVVADTYYIPQGDHPQGFETLAEAVTWLNETEIGGPTEFRITADLDETGADIVFDRNNLSSFRNLTIRADEGVSPVVRLRQLHFFATRFITIDGGSGRNLTLMLDDTEVQQAIFIEGSARDITVRNTNISFENRNENASAIYLRRIDSGSGIGAPSGIHITNNRIGEAGKRFLDGVLTLGTSDRRIQLSARNNEVYAARRGFTDWFTTGSSYSSNTVHGGAEAGIYINESDGGIYTGNILHANRGIHLFGSSGSRIDNNLIQGDIMGIDVSGAGPGREIRRNVIRLTGGASFVGQYTGINLAGASDMTRIEGNTIYSSQAHPVSSGNLRGIALGNNNSGEVWVVNNMISIQPGSDGNAGSRGIYGISHSGVLGVTAEYHIYHNSVLIGENNGTGVQAAAGTTVGSNPGIYHFRNNLLMNLKTGSNAFAVWWNAGETGSGAFSSDYNNLYAPGGSVAFRGDSVYETLENWQSASSLDASSVSKSVSFVAEDDLRLDGESVEDPDLLGTSLAGVTEDIDGNLRNPNSPQMGAHEASAAGPVEQILTEGFEESEVWPSGWGRSNARLFSDELAHDGEGGNTEGNYIGTDILDIATEISTPVLSNPGTLSFWISTYSPDTELTLLVQVSGDGTNWNTIATYNAEAGGGGDLGFEWTQKTVNIQLPGPHRIRWITDGPVTEGFFLDDISVTMGTLVDIGRVAESIPNSIELDQNYPNPFNPSTQIRYRLNETVPVRLEVYTIAGQRVQTLVNDIQQAGEHIIRFDGSSLASGMYIYRLTAGGSVTTRKLTLIK